MTHDLHQGQARLAAHPACALVEPLSTDPQAVAVALSGPPTPGSVEHSSGVSDQRTRVTQTWLVAAPDPLPWLQLRTAVEIQEAAMEYRKAFDNRLRSGASGAVFDAMRSTLHDHETKAKLHARRTYRETVPAPIREWQDATRGLGEQGTARLLGHIGHPAWKWVHEWQGEGTDRTLVLVDSSPRSFGQLIAYAGLVPGRKRSKGMTADQVARCGAPSVGPVLHSLAEAAMKSGGPLREIYDAAKESYTETRPEWGPKPGHWHNAALRIVKREILRGLWLAAQGGAPRRGCTKGGTA